MGQGLGDLDLLHPGISGGRRGERSTLLLQSRGVLGIATSAPSAGLTPQRKGSHDCSLGDSLHRASLSLRGLAWGMQCERHPCATISGAQAGLSSSTRTLPWHCSPAEGTEAVLASVPGRVGGRTGPGVLVGIPSAGLSQ